MENTSIYLLSNPQTSKGDLLRFSHGENTTNSLPLNSEPTKRALLLFRSSHAENIIHFFAFNS
jgi:hypothetical protein